MGEKMAARERSGGGPLCLPPSSGRKMAATAAGSMRANVVTRHQELDEVVYANEEGVHVVCFPVDFLSCLI